MVITVHNFFIHFLETLDFIGIHFIYLAYINADFLNKHYKFLKLKHPVKEKFFKSKERKKDGRESKARKESISLGNTHTEM